jgi:hypothetical protein
MTENQVKNCNIYFPNAFQLKIKHQIQKFDYPLISILNGVIPMHCLTKLIIKNCELDYDQFINILNVTTRLNTFGCDYLCFDDVDSYEQKKNPMCVCVLEKNKIKTFYLYQYSTLETVNMMTYLLPQIEHLKIRMNIRSFTTVYGVRNC